MIKIGKYSYISDKKINSDSGGNIIIGKFCSIANNFTVINVGHNHNWITTYPFSAFRKDWEDCEVFPSGHPKKMGDVIIGNDVWIGSDVTVLGGITIGDGAVIAAKSVVVKNIESYSIVGGNPAIFIKRRFNFEIVCKLLKIRWWNWKKEKIEKNIELLCSENIEKFIKENHEY